MTMTQKDRLAIAAIALAGLLGTAGLGSVNIAIPLIAEDLNAALSTVSWVISGYLLIIAAILITLPALFLSLLAQDRKNCRTDAAGPEEEDAAMAGF